jgi:hypothetical protein
LNAIIDGAVNAVTAQSSQKPPTDYTKAGTLETFTGKDEDWPFWKQAVEAHLKIAGLHSILVNPGYAKIHSNANKVVHGMLTKCLLKTGDFAHFPCLLKSEGDGNAAWNNICAYYEHELLVKNNLKALYNRFSDLKFTKLSDMHEFNSEFIWLKNRLEWFNSKAENLQLTGVTMYRITDWKIQYLQKIEINALKARVETLTRDENADLWYALLSIKSYILDNLIPKVGGKRRGRGKKEVQFANDSEGEDEAPEEGTSGNQKQHGFTNHALAARINAIDDPDFKKKVKQLFENGSNKEANGNKRRNGKDKRKRFKKRRSVATEAENGNESDIDAAALSLWADGK